METVHLSGPSSSPRHIRSLKGHRERDSGKKAPMGVCQLGAGFEVGEKGGAGSGMQERSEN